MAELVALDVALGAQLVDHIRRAHDRSHAVCVVDQRWSPARRHDMLEVLAPTMIVDSRGATTRLSTGRLLESGDGLVVLTSGSSGRPRAAILTWAAVIASAEMTSSELHRGRPTCWNACLPPVHIGGFAVLARSIFTDDRVMWGDGQHLDDGARQGATHVAVVRAQLHRFDLSAYHVVLLGGAKPPADVAANVVTTWGMTETGSGVVYNKRPLPGVSLAIRNGEILVASPTLLRAYRDGPAAFVAGPDGAHRWFATGDSGDFHDGELTVYGRQKYVINTGGEKVWPDDLEDALRKVNDVTDVAVIGVDDDEWGQRIVAFVVSSSTTNDIMGGCARAAEDAIGPWAKPKEIILIDEIPRTSNGKVRRDALVTLRVDAPPTSQST